MTIVIANIISFDNPFESIDFMDIISCIFFDDKSLYLVTSQSFKNVRLQLLIVSSSVNNLNNVFYCSLALLQSRANRKYLQLN